MLGGSGVLRVKSGGASIALQARGVVGLIDRVGVLPSTVDLCIASDVVAARVADIALSYIGGHRLTRGQWRLLDITSIQRSSRSVRLDSAPCARRCSEMPCCRAA